MGLGHTRGPCILGCPPNLAHIVYNTCKKTLDNTDTFCYTFAIGGGGKDVRKAASLEKARLV